MKGVLAILLIIAGHYAALAQNKDNIYVDVGINDPGVSATYDKKMTRHLDLGAGVSAYNYNSDPFATFRGAAYLDLRPYWSIGRSLLFVIVDGGLAINAGRQPVDGTMSALGYYTSLGFGYCYRINKRGMGPYISLAFDGYAETIHYTTPLVRKGNEYEEFDATSVISVGFKF